MALDYNQKKQVVKNRPRKRPVKFMLLLVLGAIISIYGFGIATGWLVFKFLPKKPPTSLADSVKIEGTGQVPPSPPPASQKGGTVVQGKEPDLTFYYTLPKGEKGVIGSGMNRLPPETAPRQTTPATTAAQNVRVPQQLKQGTEKKETLEVASPKENAGKKTYTIQVAAYHAKSDAQQLKVTLQKIGISSRIEEYTVSGKGIWYRVRTGNKLDKDTANELAAKVGNNAILVVE